MLFLVGSESEGLLFLLANLYKYLRERKSMNGGNMWPHGYPSGLSVDMTDVPGTGAAEQSGGAELRAYE